MPTMDHFGWIALGVIVVTLLAIVVGQLALGIMKRPLESRIATRYRPDQILLKDHTANCFGLESAGVWQVRGNGALVLTGEFLHFFMFLPKREFQIPVAAITSATFTKSHLGKTIARDLLKIEFSVDGKSDSIAWYLNDPVAWKKRIDELRAR